MVRSPAKLETKYYVLKGIRKANPSEKQTRITKLSLAYRLTKGKAEEEKEKLLMASCVIRLVMLWNHLDEWAITLVRDFETEYAQPVTSDVQKNDHNTKRSQIVSSAKQNG